MNSDHWGTLFSGVPPMDGGGGNALDFGWRLVGQPT